MNVEQLNVGVGVRVAGGVCDLGLSLCESLCQCCGHVSISSQCKYLCHLDVFSDVL